MRPDRMLATLGMVLFVPWFDDRRAEHTEDETGTLAESASEVVVVFEGIVFDDAGAPAEGAVVVSSAGGRTVTQRNGSYRLEVEVSSAARSLQITAVGAGSGRVASTTIDLTAESRLTWVPPLELASNACQPSWLPTFGADPGIDGSVLALAVYDDGHGPALYAAGSFASAGGVAASNIVRWDGTSWAALGSGLSSFVQALAVFDDGAGPALYASGNFRTAGGVAAERIARWDGSSWTALGSGLNAPARAMTVFDDGDGPALFVAGGFTTAGGVSAKRIAKWNGMSWGPMGDGLRNTAFALTEFDDGSGATLYVGGALGMTGDDEANHIARWNGRSWVPFGGGLTGGLFAVNALTVFDDGSGPALHAAGDFETAGGTSATGIAKWNGTSWSALGSGLGGLFSFPFVATLTAFDDGSGPALYAGGRFTIAGGQAANAIARWDGSSWSLLGSGMSTPGGGTVTIVQSLMVFDDGSGSALFAGGGFGTSGGVETNNIAKWQSSSWNELGKTGLSAPVDAVTVFDDGRGPALYAGGSFTEVSGGFAANRLARWNGSSWEALGSGLNGDVLALTVFDDGSGPALYAGGEFTTAGGGAASLVARWDGASWSALDVGWMTPVSVEDLIVFDDGSGPALYAGGDFRLADGRNIARWSGTSWEAVGGGATGIVYALAVFDDGGGPALYAGGALLGAGGLSVNRIARWSGSSWSTLGSGVSAPVLSLAVFDDGGGAALYAGGTFSSAGGTPVDVIARWDGSLWSALGSGMGGTGRRVSALHVFDDGCGPVLCAGGRFTTAGGVAASNLARWDGSSWAPLGGVTSPTGVLVPEVRALTTYNDRTGAALHVGGDFRTSSNGDRYLAKWGSPDTTAPLITCPPSLVVDDRSFTSPGEVVNFLVTAQDPQDPTPGLLCDPPSGSWFPRGTTLVTCTATDFAGNSATCQFTITVTRDPPALAPAPPPQR